MSEFDEMKAAVDRATLCSEAYFKAFEAEKAASAKLLNALERLQSRETFTVALCEFSQSRAIWDEMTARIVFAHNALVEYRGDG